jgi:ubiquinone/menaquinone biosynthesis C-methylase UbiE
MMLSKSQVLQHFDGMAIHGDWSKLYDQDQDDMTNYSFRIRRERVVELLDPILRPGMHVLDVGCGTGIMAPLVLRRKAHYQGVDLSRNMIHEARQKHLGTEASEGSVAFTVADVERMPLPDAHYDVLLALGLLEYFENPQRVVDEIIRVVKPGGSVIVSVPNVLCVDTLTSWLFSPILTTPMKYLRRMRGRATQASNYRNHKYRPTKLDKMFLARGFRKTGAVYYNLEAAAYPLRRLLPNLALRIKKTMETYQHGPLRVFATAYVARFTKPATASK